MEEKHYIEFIELIADGQAAIAFLKPGQPPQASFCLSAKTVTGPRLLQPARSLERSPVMIGKKLHKTINDQIKNELESAYLYLAMAAYFHREGLRRFPPVDAGAGSGGAGPRDQVLRSPAGSLCRDRITETLGHPQVRLELAAAGLQEAYQHEQFITGKINNLVRSRPGARSHRPAHAALVHHRADRGGGLHLQDRQTLERIGKDGGALVMLDRELGARVFTPPPATPELGAGAA